VTLFLEIVRVDVDRYYIGEANMSLTKYLRRVDLNRLFRTIDYYVDRRSLRNLKRNRSKLLYLYLRRFSTNIRTAPKIHNRVSKTTLVMYAWKIERLISLARQ